MYKEVFLRSIKKLRLSLFIPDLYLTFIELLLASFFIKFTGISSLVSNPDFIAASIEDKLPVITTFLSENMINLIIYFIVFFFTSFILGASLNTMRYGMVRDTILGERYSFRKVLNYGVGFWPIVIVRVILFLFGVAAFLFVSGSYIILKSFLSPSLVIFFVTLLGIGAILLLKLLFMFAFATMFFEHTGAFASVKNSFVYFFRNKIHVFKVFLIVFLVSLIILPFEFALARYQGLFGLLSFYTILFLVFRNVSSALYNVWSEFLIFNSYKVKPLSP